MKLKKNAQVIEYSPTEELLDETFIAKAVWECLKNNDPEGVVEIIETHLEIVNKAKNAQKNDLSRSTMYHALKRKNPTIKTLAKMVNCFSTTEEVNEDCCIAH
jgi:DNA-binding phage protein